MLNFLKDLLIPAIPVLLGIAWMWWKQRVAAKKLAESNLVAAAKLSEENRIENTKSILAASRELRIEAEEDKKELRESYREEKEINGQMAKTIIRHENKINEISIRNNVLFKHLKIILGMRTIIDIKKVKIFVLEDNPDDTVLLKRILIGVEQEIVYFSDPDKFYAAIDPEVRIIIVDQNLGVGKTGLDMITKIVEVNDYRYFVMLSGSEDFDLIYKFNRSITHGVYILKGMPDTSELLLRSIKTTLYYLKILSDTYNEIREGMSDEEAKKNDF